MLKDQLLNEIKVLTKKQMLVFKISFYLLFIALVFSISLDLHEILAATSDFGFSFFKINSDTFLDAFEKNPGLIFGAFDHFYRGLFHLLVLTFCFISFRVETRAIKKNKKLLSIVSQIPDNI